MKRLTNADECKKVTNGFPDCSPPEGWLDNPANFAYIDDLNAGFAEERSPGVYWVHFCFQTARGRAAINLTRQMIEVLFKDTSFKSLVALVAVDNKKARWLVRQVGFQPLDFTTTEQTRDACQVFFLTSTGQTDEFFKF